MKAYNTRTEPGDSLSRYPGNKVYYRTVVENTNDVPIKVVWFDFSFKTSCGSWTSNNITNSVMREEQFLKWYSDGSDTFVQDGWIQPGAKAVSDINWNFGTIQNFDKCECKWSFIAVDSQGKTYFDEAVVEKDSVDYYVDENCKEDTRNKVVGFQITASNESKINDFYAKSFGWELSAGPHEHVTNVDTGNHTLEGSVLGRGDYIPDYVSLFVESSDITKTIEDCVKNGAQLIRPQFELENNDKLAIIADPEGHVITLIDKAE